MGSFIVLLILLAIAGFIISFIVEMVQFGLTIAVIFAVVLLMDYLLKQRKTSNRKMMRSTKLPGLNSKSSGDPLLDKQIRIKNTAAYKIKQQTNLRYQVMNNPIYVMAQPGENERDIRGITMMDSRYEVIFSSEFSMYSSGRSFAASRPYIRKVLQASTCLISYDTEDLLHRLDFNDVHYHGHYITVKPDFERYNGQWDRYFDDFKTMDFKDAEAFFGLDHAGDLKEQCQHLIDITDRMMDAGQILIESKDEGL